MKPEELKQLMAQQNWSIEDLRSILHCSKWAVYKYLDGSRTMPPLAIHVIQKEMAKNDL